MAEFNPNGEQYKKYVDPKTDAKTKAKLYATYGKRYNWPKDGASTTPPTATPGTAAPLTTGDLSKVVFGKDAGSFDAAGALADMVLGKVQEDPRITELISRLNTQSQQGLLAPENTALRESALQGINDAMQVAQRQSALNAVGTGRPTGFDNPAIFNDYLRARGGLESDILAKNIDYKTNQQNQYGNLLTSRDNELFNRNYGRSQDVLGYATSGAGWSADQRQQAQANKFTQQAINAMKADGAAGGAALSIPGVSSNMQGTNSSASAFNQGGTGTVWQNKNPSTSWNSGSNYGG